MSIPQSVAEVLREHVTLEIEGIDRMYLNVYVPQLQREGGVASFFRYHRGYPFAQCVDGVRGRDGGLRGTRGGSGGAVSEGPARKDYAAEHLKRFTKPEGVLFIGKAQEKTPVFRTERRRNAETGVSYPWLIRSTAMVNHFYVYCMDRDFGPFFLKFCTHFPYTTTCRPLFSVLVLFSLQARGFTNSDMRALLAQLLGLDPAHYPRGRMSYDLRRLRLHGLIARIPHSHRYEPTTLGLRAALFFSRTYARLLRPILADISPNAPPGHSPIRAAFERLQTLIDQACQEAQLVAG